MIAGIVLAAGEGRRFGGPKQLAELDGRPLLARALDAMRGVAEIDRVAVVLGAHAERIREAIDLGGVEIVVAEDWEDGPGASLRAGLGALAGADAYVVTLADQPLITTEVIARFANARGTCRAAYHGAPGHPVRLSAREASRVLELRGTAGPRELLLRFPAIEIGAEGRPEDVDTGGDLRRLSSP